MILADSDVLIDALRGREPSATRIADALRLDALATTAISAFELTSGARSERQSSSIGDLLGAIQVVPFDLTAATAASRVRQHLEAEGLTIGMADYLIAGIALSRSLPLLTRNHRHFSRIPDLLLVDL